MGDTCAFNLTHTMERITHELIQGSPEWLAYRAQHDNASDAAAMLGCSPFKTRSELLHERYLGLSKDFSDYVQERVLNPGHEFEALARTKLAEVIIGEDLFPVTMSAGSLSASLDGLTFNERQHWEHKRLSNELAELMPNEFNSAECLPKYHRVQIEHQFMVTPSEECLFTASKWNGDQLLDARHAWVFPDMELRSEIEAGWAQFRLDLAAYIPPKAEPPKAVGKTMESLPALSVSVEGKVLASNVGAWKDHALATIRSVNRELSTDEDFATAANMVKWCGTVEENCDTARTYTLSQTASIADVLKALDDVQADARKCRLDLAKLVTARKVERKDEIVGEAVAALHKHVAELNDTLTPYRLPNIVADFAGQTARKSSFKSMQDGVSLELARAKIEASGTALRIKVNATRIGGQPEFAFLFNDAAALVVKDADHVEAVVKSRIMEHKAEQARKEEEQRARIAAEEKEKAEAAARAQANEILRQEARDREAAAEKKRADEAAAAERRNQDEASQRERVQAEADLHKLGQAGAPVASAVAESIVSSSLETFERVKIPPGGSWRVPDGRIATNIGTYPLEVIGPIADADPEHAWINLGKMNEAFGFAVTADFIVNTLGFQWTRTEKAAKFWTPTQFEAIKRKLAAHVLDATAFPF